MYKCINNIGPVYLCSHFKVKELSYNMRDQNNKCVLPKVNTVRHGVKNFVFYDSSCWNKLPLDIKSADTVISFKKQLSAEVTTLSEI